MGVGAALCMYDVDLKSSHSLCLCVCVKPWLHVKIKII